MTTPTTDPFPFTDWEMSVLGVVSRVVGDPPGGFASSLIDAALRADPSNFARLSLGFPEMAEAVTAWKRGDLRQRAQQHFSRKDV